MSSRGRRPPIRTTPAPAPADPAARRAAAQAASRWPTTRDIAEALERLPHAADGPTLAAAAREVICGAPGEEGDHFLRTFGNTPTAGDRDALTEQWRRILERPHTLAPGRSAARNGTVLRADASAEVLADQVAEWQAAGLGVELSRVIYAVAGSPPSHVANMRFQALVARTQIKTPEGPATIEVWAHTRRTTRNPRTQERDLRALGRTGPVAELVGRALEQDPERMDTTWVPLLDGFGGQVSPEAPEMGIREATGLGECTHQAASWRLSEGWEAAVLDCPTCRRPGLAFAPLHRLDPADPALPGPIREQVRALTFPEGWIPYRTRWQALRPLLGEQPLPGSLADARAGEPMLALGAEGPLAPAGAGAASGQSGASAYRAPSLREVLSARR